MSDPWKEFVTRFVELLKEDEELHTAVIGLLGAHAQAEEARADHERALAARARK